MTTAVLSTSSILFVEIAHDLIRRGLSCLFDEIQRCNYYVRGHEVVNLLAFGHLVPLLRDRGFEATHIGVEFPVMQVGLSEKALFGASPAIRESPPC